MPTILLRLLLVCKLLNSILACLLPKNIRSFLTSYSFSSKTTSATGQNPTAATAASRGALSRSLSSSAASSNADGLHRSSPDLDRMFRMFDRNGDGKITRSELSDSLQDLGIFITERDLAAVIARVDADGDGCIDAREFAELYEEIMGEKGAGGVGVGDERAAEEEEMREVFYVFDENGDGYITVEELQSVLDSLGVRQGRSVEDCRSMIRNVDVDGDGRVDYEEFKRMMRQGGLCAVAS